jgi:hypothetical protein
MYSGVSNISFDVAVTGVESSFAQGSGKLQVVDLIGERWTLLLLRDLLLHGPRRFHSSSVHASDRCTSEPASHSRKPLTRSRPDAGRRLTAASLDRKRGLPTNRASARQAQPSLAIQARRHHLTYTERVEAGSQPVDSGQLRRG